MRLQPGVPAAPVRGLRTDIQGLRAVAVAMVVVFHLYPSALPGGYVGVDVFFVISGFLITSHLISRTPTGWGDLVGFWGRRIRRLLPASLTVIAVTLIAVHVILPSTQWDPNAHDARAAALYFVNWELAGNAVSYLSEGQDPSAFQHFWSLAVEEQFYLVWPILIGALALVAVRLRISRRAVFAVGLTTVVVASFVYSVVHTASDPAASYFISTTRAWELGVGGLVALLVRRLRAQRPPLTATARGVITWGGLAMICAAGILYSGTTAFPGSAAALPVLGAALLILGAGTADDRRTPGPLLARRPVQWLGDISYSVYLWHWPLRVLVPFVAGRSLPGETLSLGQGGAVLVMTLVLATLTERYIERPFRNPAFTTRIRATLVVAGTAMVAVVALATAQLVSIGHAEAQGRHRLHAVLTAGGQCLGAASLDPGTTCPSVKFGDVVPMPILAEQDLSPAFVEVSGRECRALPAKFWMRTCIFGQPHGHVHIGLLGNSHADQWLPALQAIAKQDDLQIETRVASRCAAADARQTMPTPEATVRCQRWVGAAVRTLIRHHPDLVVMSDRVSGDDPSDPAVAARYAEGFRKVLAQLVHAGQRVMVIRDTPTPATIIPECVAAHQNDTSPCDGQRSDWLRPDPTITAVDEINSPLITVVDLADHICGPQVCHAITGGVITYADASHLTATYSHTLGPYLEAEIRAVLPGKIPAAH